MSETGIPTQFQCALMAAPSRQVRRALIRANDKALRQIHAGRQLPRLRMGVAEDYTTRSKYMPHQGKREMQRRVGRAA